MRSVAIPGSLNEYAQPWHDGGLRAAVVYALLLASCGRWNFDALDGGATDATDGTDATEVEQARIIVASGPTPAQFLDVAIGPAGELAVIGIYEAMTTIGGRTVTTSVMQDMFVGVVELDGTARWLATLGASIIGSGQNVTWAADTIYAGGFFAGTTSQIGPFSSGSGQDVLLLTYDPAGQLMLGQSAGGSANVQLRGLDVLGSTVAGGGIYGGTPDLGAGPLPAGTIDNGFVITDFAGSTPAQRALISSVEVYVNDLAFHDDGSLCVTGRFNGTADFGGGSQSASGSSAFVALYEANLGYRWSRVFGSGATGNNVTRTAGGDCVAAGTFSGSFSIDSSNATSLGDDDVYAIRFDGASGQASWLQTVAGPEIEGVFGIEALPSDRIALAGRFTGTASIAGMSAQSDGTRDAYVLVLTADGARDYVEIIAGAGSIASSLGGVGLSPSGTTLGVALQFSGELRVRELVVTSTEPDGAIVTLPIRP